MYLYGQSLEVVEGKVFYPEEVDTLACLVGSKVLKRVASLLFVAQKTAKNRIEKVIKKLDCKSRTDAIQFIEKCENYSLLKERYFCLLKEACFRKTLQSIAKDDTNRSATYSSSSSRCLLIFDRDQEEEVFFVQQLKKYLKIAGMKVFLSGKSSKTPDVFFQPSSSVNVDCAVYLIGKKDSISQNIQSNKQTHQFIVPVVWNDEHIFPYPEDVVSFLKFKNYYLAFFELLKRLRPEISYDSYVKGFEDGTFSSMPTPSPSPTAYKKKKPFSSKIQSFFSIDKHRKEQLFIGVFLCVTSAASLCFTLKGQGKNIEAFSPSELTDISADLDIPVQNVFLNRPKQILSLKNKVNKLSKQKTDSISLISILGMAGVGKTTLARHYAKLYPASLTWEINAQTKESVIESYYSLAYVLAQSKGQKEEIEFIRSITNQSQQETQLLFFIKKCLKQRPDWLLIYDNMENLSNIKSYLPRDKLTWGNGKIIITTRNANVANTNYIKLENVLELGELSEKEALSLFCKILYSCESSQLQQSLQDNALRFLKNIPYFPLDISAAAYYIKDTQISFDQYLKELKGSTDHQLEYPPESSVDYGSSRYKILTLSFQKLLEENPDFEDLLLLVCLLDSQNIPKELLGLFKPTHLFDNFIRALKKYSLITVEQQQYKDQKRPTLSIHRATQQIGIAFLLKKLDTKKVQMINKVVTAVSNYNDMCVKEDFHKSLLLLPHLQELLNHLSKLEASNSSVQQSLQEVLYTMGNIHYRCSRNLIFAKDYFTQAYKKYLEQTPGLSNDKVILLLKNLGIICNDLELSDEAVFYAQESLKLAEKIQNSTATKIENFKTLGFAYTYKNNFTQAKAYFEKALNLLSSLKTSLRNAPESRVYSSLGWLYSVTFIAQEKANPGIAYLQKALELVDGNKTFYNGAKSGQITSDIARYKTTLGDIYCRTGQYDKALNEGFNDAQFIIDNSLDNSPHELLKIYIQIGMSEILLRKGELSESKNTVNKALLAIEKLAGSNSSLVLSPKIFGIEAQIRLGELEDAYKSCEELFTFKMNSHTNYSSLLYLTNFYYAAVIKHKQKNYNKSLNHFQEFFKLLDDFCKNFFSPQEYLSLKNKHIFEMSPYTTEQEEIQIALCLKKSLEIYTQIYGFSHPFVKDFVKNNI